MIPISPNGYNPMMVMGVTWRRWGFEYFSSRVGWAPMPKPPPPRPQHHMASALFRTRFQRGGQVMGPWTIDR